MSSSCGSSGLVNTGEYAGYRFHGLHFEVPYQTCTDNGCGNNVEPFAYPRPSMNHTDAAPTGNPFSRIVGPNMYGVPDGSPKAPNVTNMYYTSVKEAQCAMTPKKCPPPM